MKLDDFLDIYELISSGTNENIARKQSILLRKKALLSYGDIVKNAFDTRRINQETEYNPRRGLQNYHRSEKFVSDAMNEKIVAFAKLAKVCDDIKLDFGKEPEWQDSYTRVLASSVHKGLRTLEIDGDYSDAQPSIGSLAYLEELIFVRYRLTAESLMKMNDIEIRAALLAKDESLIQSNVPSKSEDFIIKPSDISKNSYDSMVDKMLTTMAQVMSSYKPPQQEDDLTTKLFNVKATKDSPEVERTVTITIKDKLIDKDALSKQDVLVKPEIVIEE